MTVIFTLQVTMKKFNDARHHAASAWVSTGGDISKATDMFTETLVNLGMELPQAPASFVRYWGEPWSKVKSVSGCASNSGRHRKISSKQAQRCVNIVLNWREDGRPGPYRSVQDLVNNSAYVRGLKETTGASNRTIARAMQRMCPSLSYKRLVVKAKLTDQHRQARVAVCKKHLKVPDNVLDTVVWIDAKTMHMNITHRYGWVDALREDIYETTRPSTRKSNVIKLKYYIAVNARLGPVMLVFYTGTTGMPAERDGMTYLVSGSHVQLGGLVLKLVSHCLLNQIAPALLTAPLRPRHQPHDVKTSIHCCSSQSMVPVHPVHQISICIIGSSVMLLCVLFPLDFYQKFEWRGCHHIPCMPADLHVFAIVHELASNCICLNSELADALQLV